MTSNESPTAMRALGVVRLMWAGLLFAAPSVILERVGGDSDARAVAVARVLGARHGLQGTVEILTGPRWRKSGAAVDLAHAATGIALAAADPRWRRVALSDAVVASTFAGVGLIA